MELGRTDLKHGLLRCRCVGTAAPRKEGELVIEQFQNVLKAPILRHLAGQKFGTCRCKPRKRYQISAIQPHKKEFGKLEDGLGALQAQPLAFCMGDDEMYHLDCLTGLVQGYYRRR